MSKSTSRLIQGVLQVEREWVRARRELDIVALDQLMAKDYVHITQDGRVIVKQEDLPSYKSGQRQCDFA